MNKHLTNRNSTEHENISFDVVVSKINHSVKWLINGVEINESDRFRLVKINELKFGLEIYDVQLTDAGSIKCIVYNDKGEEVLQSEAQLDVQGKKWNTFRNIYKILDNNSKIIEPPLDIIKGLSNVKVDEKGEIIFQCRFSREPKFEEVRWYKDGQLLSEENDSRIKYVNEGERQYLHIKNAKLSDIGNYKVKVKDVESTSSLKVKGNWIRNMEK
jgi:hypothetical protein